MFGTWKDFVSFECQQNFNTFLHLSERDILKLLNLLKTLNPFTHHTLSLSHSLSLSLWVHFIISNSFSLFSICTSFLSLFHHSRLISSYLYCCFFPLTQSTISFLSEAYLSLFLIPLLFLHSFSLLVFSSLLFKLYLLSFFFLFLFLLDNSFFFFLLTEPSLYQTLLFFLSHIFPYSSFLSLLFLLPFFSISLFLSPFPFSPSLLSPTFISYILFFFLFPFSFTGLPMPIHRCLYPYVCSCFCSHGNSTVKESRMTSPGFIPICL